MDKRIEITKDSFSNEKELDQIVNRACDLMEQIYDDGDYPKLMVKRSWSEHNPIITGEMALPQAYRWYLKREMKKLLEKGAETKIFPSRPRVAMNDPVLFDNADEDDWDITQKKIVSLQPGKDRYFTEPAGALYRNKTARLSAVYIVHQL